MLEDIRLAFFVNPENGGKKVLAIFASVVKGYQLQGLRVFPPLEKVFISQRNGNASDAAKDVRERRRAWSRNAAPFDRARSAVGSAGDWLALIAGEMLDFP